MHLGTGVARDEVYGFVNQGGPGTAERWRCGAALAPAQHMPAVETYTYSISGASKKKKHKELEYTNSHCSGEGIK